jgi:hypothetical protein
LFVNRRKAERVEEIASDVIHTRVVELPWIMVDLGSKDATAAGRIHPPPTGKEPVQIRQTGKLAVECELQV